MPNTITRGRNLITAGLTLVAGLAVTTAARAADDVRAWNVYTLNTLALNGQNNIVQTRTLAMVHAAIHDALNAIEQRHEPYAFSFFAPSASPEAAVAAAAHGVLLWVIPDFGTPTQQAAARAAANAAYTSSIAMIPDGPARHEGILVGAAAAAAVLAIRAGDGARHAEIPYVPLEGPPGFWQPTPNPNPPDPASGGPGLAPALLPGWGNVMPFTLRRGRQFRPSGPLPLFSRRYARDYNEVQSIGQRLSTSRTTEQSEIARFWYEGSQLGWNRIARLVSEPRMLDLWEQSRLFALVNFAMADGFIAGFNTRYFYNSWRPVTAIREGDADGNDETVGDRFWESFLNTPAIPDYPSTHSVLGGAAATVLAHFFGADDIAFTTTSGAPFPGITRSFTSFSQAAQENADSRVYAGIHFRKSCRDGVRLGHRIGAFTVRRALKPMR
jgi:hypothetical protein